MSVRLAVVASVLAAALLSSGCCKPLPTTMVTLDRLVGEYNANAARVPRLWARAKVEVSLPLGAGLDYQVWGSTSSRAEPNAVLLLFKGEDRVGPQDFVLIGSELGTEIFRTGCSTADGAYYFWHRFGGDAALLWGRNEYAGAPGAAALPIDPLQILAVLGVCELPSDFTRTPTVALSMDTTPCSYAYVVTYLDRQPVTGRILFRREMYFTWDDHERRRAFRVDFFDSRGLRVMRAELKDYKPVAVVGCGGDGAAAVMPTDIRITWQGRKASVHIVLSEMQVDLDRGDPDVCKLWDRLPDDITRRIQVDRDVGLEGREDTK